MSLSSHYHSLVRIFSQHIHRMTNGASTVHTYVRPSAITALTVEQDMKSKPTTMSHSELQE